MDNVKMPFISEEAMRAQRVELYLDDLKTRLKDLRQQHDEVIQNSVEIIKEIDQVSSTLLMPPTNTATSSTEQLPKIKQLINEFESAKMRPVRSTTAAAAVAIDSKVNIRNILQNFEKLNQCHVLKESLVLFKRAKESFEKIDTIISKTDAKTDSSCKRQVNAKPTNVGNTESGVVAQCSTALKPSLTAVREIDCEPIRESPSNYTSCCSLFSLDTYHSTEELNALKCINSSTNSMENGYDGDNEYSEMDLSANIQKRQKLK